MAAGRAGWGRGDLLLVGPALGAWLAALTVLRSVLAVADPGDRRAWVVRVLLGTGAVAVVAIVAVGRALRRRPPSGVTGSGRRVAVGLTLLGAAAAAVTAALHAAALSAAPVADWARQRVVADVVVRIEGDARVRTGRTAGSWRTPDTASVRARLVGVGARGQTHEVDVPVQVVLGPRAGPAPPDGTLVAFAARLSPGPPGADVAATVSVTTPGRVQERPGVVAAAAERVRAGLRGALAGRDPDAAALVAGLAVGDESLQPPELADAMRTSGLSHLTAVSGGNVALVLVVVLALARTAGLRRRGRGLVAALALVGFVVLVRPQPSVLRAAAMGSVAVLALVLGARRRAVPALAAAVLVLVVSTPVLAVSVGFALSVAATAGLLVLARPLREALDRWPPVARLPPVVLDAATITLAAQVATAPLIAALGGGIGLAAIPANLLAAPAVAPVTVLGLAAALVSVPAPGLAAALAHAAAVPAAWIAGVAHRCAALPMAQVPWPDGAGGGILLAAAAGAAVCARVAWRRSGRPPLPPATRRAVAAVAAVLFVLVLLRPPSSAGWPPPGWVLVACDVGQGDGLVVRTGPGRALVVDAGPDAERMDRCLADLGIDTVPAVLLTHDHADHVEGLPGVLRGRSVGAVMTTPLRDPAEEAERVDRWAAQSSAARQVVAPGEQRVDGEVAWRVLWPRRIIRGEGSVPNNASAVLLVDAPGLRLLLPGDVEPAAQVAIAAAEPSPAADVVKVPHHGSRYQAPGFAAWAGASLALVSVGEGNDYGHPAPETLQAYAAAGALVARTDLQGDLAVVVDETGQVGLVTRR